MFNLIKFLHLLTNTLEKKDFTSTNISDDSLFCGEMYRVPLTEVKLCQ